jgi:hypothetical protein
VIFSNADDEAWAQHKHLGDQENSSEIKINLCQGKTCPVEMINLGRM